MTCINLPLNDIHPDLYSLDALAQIVLPTNRLLHDRELFQTKWWDYRFMTPVEATAMFIDQFGIEARKIYARDIDYERSKYITVVNAKSVIAGLISDDKKAKAAFSSFWRGRQVADALMMPYQTYIYESLSNRMRYWKNVTVENAQGKLRTKFPKPNHIYDERDVERVQKRWEELKKANYLYAEHYVYMPQNYRGLEHQKAYNQYLIDRAMTSSDPKLTLLDMINDDKLSVEYAETVLDGYILKAISSQI